VRAQATSERRCYLARASAPTASQARASAGAAGLVRAGVIAAGLESGHRRRPQAEHIADGETPPVPDLADCNLSDAMVVVAGLPRPKLRLPVSAIKPYCGFWHRRPPN